MNRFPLPTDERLERLIRDSFDYMPGPDMRRIEQLEKKLARAALPSDTRSPNTLPWWIVLLLAGSFATAAWWAGEKFSNSGSILPESVPMQPVPVESDADKQTNSGNNLPVPAESAAGQRRESSVIYQRENF